MSIPHADVGPKHPFSIFIAILLFLIFYGPSVKSMSNTKNNVCICLDVFMISDCYHIFLIGGPIKRSNKITKQMKMIINSSFATMRWNISTITNHNKIIEYLQGYCIDYVWLVSNIAFRNKHSYCREPEKKKEEEELWPTTISVVQSQESPVIKDDDYYEAVYHWNYLCGEHIITCNKNRFLQYFYSRVDNHQKSILLRINNLKHKEIKNRGHWSKDIQKCKLKQ